jgi:hypothetical protein
MATSVTVTEGASPLPTGAVRMVTELRNSSSSSSSSSSDSA